MPDSTARTSKTHARILADITFREANPAPVDTEGLSLEGMYSRFVKGVDARQACMLAAANTAEFSALCHLVDGHSGRRAEMANWAIRYLLVQDVTQDADLKAMEAGYGMTSFNEYKKDMTPGELDSLSHIKKTSFLPQDHNPARTAAKYREFLVQIVKNEKAEDVTEVALSTKVRLVAEVASLGGYVGELLPYPDDASALGIEIIEGISADELELLSFIDSPYFTRLCTEVDATDAECKGMANVAVRLLLELRFAKLKDSYVGIVSIGTVRLEVFKSLMTEEQLEDLCTLGDYLSFGASSEALEEKYEALLKSLVQD